MQVDINFVSLLSWEGFIQHKLRHILCPRWHVRGMLNTCWDAFGVLPGIGWVWSTHIELHFVSPLALEVFGQDKLRCILCPRWRERIKSTNVEMHFCICLQRRGLFDTCLDTFWVLVGTLGVWLTYVGMHFVSSMAWNGIGQVMLR